MSTQTRFAVTCTRDSSTVIVGGTSDGGYAQLKDAKRAANRVLDRQASSPKNMRIVEARVTKKGLKIS